MVYYKPSAAEAEKIKAIKPFKPTKDAPVPTIGQLKGVLPPEIFERSLLHGLALVLRDGLIIAALGYAAWQLPFAGEALTPLVLAAWVVYALLQGTAMTGWWVLAHECGHGGFSDYEWVNDTVGFVLHTMLYVPYFSWQYSHHKHHSKTNHLLDGETHVPPKGVRGLNKKLSDFMSEDIFAMWQLVSHLVLGWPLYLLFNSTGARRRFDRKRYTSTPSHFSPTSELFPAKWRVRVAISTIGIIAWSAVLYYVGSQITFTRLALMYFFPYMVTNGWLVLYTWLQHVNEYVPQYGEDEWTWMKGALSTIDRPYWYPIGVFMHHSIGTSHVAHHIFSSMPCYNGERATAYLKQYLGDLYHYDERPLIQATWVVARDCHYVDDIVGAQKMKSIYKHAATEGKKSK